MERDTVQSSMRNINFITNTIFLSNFLIFTTMKNSVNEMFFVFCLNLMFCCIPVICALIWWEEWRFAATSCIMFLWFLPFVVDISTNQTLPVFESWSFSFGIFSKPYKLDPNLFIIHRVFFSKTSWKIRLNYSICICCMNKGEVQITFQ